MISYLKGKVVLDHLNFIIVDVSGIGYKVFVLPTIGVKKNETITLFTHQNLKEDISDLYGFKNFDELEVFQKLISVNGVGPKAGMAIMSQAGAKKIAEAIEGEDMLFFTSIPGIGKKVAAKIILDLKSKITSEGAGNLTSDQSSNDVIEALLSLGYKKPDINKIIHKFPSKLKSDQEKIKWAMNNLSGR